MNIINNFAQYIQKLFNWWVIIMPFEQGMRIRFGKKVTILSPGTWLKIPFFDCVYVQNTRLNALQTPTQTVTTTDGKTITIIACIMFRVDDVLTLYKTLNHPERTLVSMVMSEVSDFISRNEISDCLPAAIESHLLNKIGASKFGLADVSLRITGYAVVKTFRIIRGDDWYVSPDIDMDKRRGEGAL